MLKLKLVGAVVVFGAYILSLPGLYGGTSPLGWETPGFLTWPAELIFSVVAMPALIIWGFVSGFLFGYEGVEFLDMKDTTVPASMLFLMGLAGWFIWGRILEGQKEWAVEVWEWIRRKKE